MGRPTWPGLAITGSPSLAADSVTGLPDGFDAVVVGTIRALFCHLRDVAVEGNLWDASVERILVSGQAAVCPMMRQRLLTFGSFWSRDLTHHLNYRAAGASFCARPALRRVWCACGANCDGGGGQRGGRHGLHFGGV